MDSHRTLCPAAFDLACNCKDAPPQLSLIPGEAPPTEIRYQLTPLGHALLTNTFGRDRAGRRL